METVQGNEIAAAQVRAYEEVLAAVLDFRTADEVRDVFGRPLVQAAAVNYAKALAHTRDLKQPESFALSWAVESVIETRMRDSGHDIGQMFNDPDYHTPPPDELSAEINAMWEAPR
jgi:hypothetical protein